ncbi:MAG: hypothetical protein M3O70_10825, partial [Actinomycetota bacterium]|nr:hypothetical protein [Actinomycetota bacterium]
ELAATTQTQGFRTSPRLAGPADRDTCGDFKRLAANENPPQDRVRRRHAPDDHRQDRAQLRERELQRRSDA